MNAQHPAPETPREYGELYYSADDVRAILRDVAELLEDDKRRVVLRLSHHIPSTMPWIDNSGDLQQSASFSTIYRDVLLGVEYMSLLGTRTIRLNALLRRGPINQCVEDGEHIAGLADKQQDAP